MATIEGEIFIERPPGEVFDFVADERHEPKYNPQMVRVEKLTSGPVREGTTYRAWMRSGTRTSEMLIESTQFDPPRILSSSTTLKHMTIHGTLTFSPDGEGTRMSWSWPAGDDGASSHAPASRRSTRTLARKANLDRSKDLLEGEKTEKVEGISISPD